MRVICVGKTLLLTLNIDASTTLPQRHPTPLWATKKIKIEKILIFLLCFLDHGKRIEHVSEARTSIFGVYKHVQRPPTSPKSRKRKTKFPFKINYFASQTPKNRPTDGGWRSEHQKHICACSVLGFDAINTALHSILAKNGSRCTQMSINVAFCEGTLRHQKNWKSEIFEKKNIFF